MYNKSHRIQKYHDSINELNSGKIQYYKLKEVVVLDMQVSNDFK